MALALARDAGLEGLLIPADDQRPSQVVAVLDSAAGLSDAIGGGLLEEIHRDVLAGCAYCVYADEERATKRLPPNGKAVVLAARLGWIDQADRLGLHGNLLIVGAETPGRDTNVPPAVLDAAAGAGLPPPRTP